MGLELLCRQGTRPKLVGHRGACEIAPENTIPSFELALKGGADLVELDVRLTADGHVVVMHDATVDRTTDGTGYVAEMTLDEIQRLDAGSWFAPEFAGAQVPTLEEVLLWAQGKVGLLIEFKSPAYGAFDALLAPATAELIQSTDMVDLVATISYQPRSLVQLKTLIPAIPAGPMGPPGIALTLAARLTHRWPRLARAKVIRRNLLRPLAFTRAWACDVVAPNIDVATPVLIEAAHAAGLPVSCGGLLWDYPGALAMGVDTISANNPGAVRALYL